MNGVARVPVFLAVAIFAGGAIGCGGSLVGTDAGGGTGSGGSSGTPEVYNWPGATIRVAPTSVDVDNLTVVVTDLATPPAPNTTLQFPSTTRWDPTDGAGVLTQYTCSTPGLTEVHLVSCAGQNHLDRDTWMPGCLVAVFTPGGTTGTFITPKSFSCDITSAKATIQLPPASGGAPSDVAVGTFDFECMGSDGIHLLLDGHFVLRSAAWTLLC